MKFSYPAFVSELKLVNKISLSVQIAFQSSGVPRWENRNINYSFRRDQRTVYETWKHGGKSNDHCTSQTPPSLYSDTAITIITRATKRWVEWKKDYIRKPTIVREVEKLYKFIFHPRWSFFEFNYGQYLVVSAAQKVKNEKVTRDGGRRWETGVGKGEWEGW